MLLLQVQVLDLSAFTPISTPDPDLRSADSSYNYDDDERPVLRLTGTLPSSWGALSQASMTCFSAMLAAPALPPSPPTPLLAPPLSLLVL